MGALFLTCSLVAVFSPGLSSNHTFKEREVSGLFLSTNPIMRAAHLWSHLTLIISQTCHVRIPSHWWPGLQHIGFVGTQFSSWHSVSEEEKTCSLFLPSDTVWRQLKEEREREGGRESQLILEVENRFFKVTKSKIVKSLNRLFYASFHYIPTGRVGGSWCLSCVHLFIYLFYWSIVNSQCCVSFQWFSYTNIYTYTHTHIYSFSDSFSL